MTVNEGLSTDNPQPTVNFKTNDALSGLDRYDIRIDAGDGITASIDWFYYKLPIQPPGKHLIRVIAVDKAGNTKENSTEIEILPIVSPLLTSISKEIFVGEGNLLVKGIAQPGYIVKITAKRKSGEVEAESLATTDKSGNWEVIIDQPLKSGQHFIEITAQDQRGALSLPVKSDFFKVRERPLFTIAGFGITQFWFFTGLILLLLIGVAAGVLAYKLWKAQLGRKVVVAQRDVVSSFGNISKDIDKMLSRYSDKKLEDYEASEIEFLLKKTKGDVEKMQKYIVENIEEISD